MQFCSLSMLINLLITSNSTFFITRYESGARPLKQSCCHYTIDSFLGLRKYVPYRTSMQYLLSCLQLTPPQEALHKDPRTSKDDTTGSRCSIINSPIRQRKDLSKASATDLKDQLTACRWSELSKMPTIMRCIVLGYVCVFA